MTRPSEKAKYRFDGFTVDAEDFVVKKDGTSLTLTPRAFDVLLLLLQHSGHVVEKQDLFEKVWKGSFVSDNALTKIIKELRHVLADSAGTPRYIETIPKRGYRFIGTLEDEEKITNDDVELVQSSPATKKIFVLAAIVIAAAAIIWFAYDKNKNAAEPSTIAVLPFKPLDAQSRDESLELGMAETLITRLSNLHDIVVRPISSVRKFADAAQDPVKAGEELQSAAVLDGSIQKSGDRVRVTVRMIDVKSGATLWSEQFDESFTDIFRVQDSISQRIAAVLALKLNRREAEQLTKHMTDDPEAYELYLHGQFLWHRRGPDWINQSLNEYKLALEKDPNFALAHVGVADGYIMLSGHRFITMQEAEAIATPSIMRALQIDDSLAQAHNALAELKYQYQYDWRGAEAEFKTAIELNPNVSWIRQAYGWFLMSEGRFDEANTQVERARQLDPGSLTLNAARARLYYYSRQYDRAIQSLKELVEQQPSDDSLRLALAAAYERKQMYPEAFDEMLRALTLIGIPPKTRSEYKEAFDSQGWEGYLRRVVSKIEGQGANMPALLASNYAKLGDKEKTFYWLDRAFDTRDVAILQFKVDPAYDFLRDDPRYAPLLQRIGLEP